MRPGGQVMGPASARTPRAAPGSMALSSQLTSGSTSHAAISPPHPVSHSTDRVVQLINQKFSDCADQKKRGNMIGEVKKLLKTNPASTDDELIGRATEIFRNQQKTQGITDKGNSRESICARKIRGEVAKDNKGHDIEVSYGSGKTPIDVQSSHAIGIVGGMAKVNDSSINHTQFRCNELNRAGTENGKKPIEYYCVANETEARAIHAAVGPTGNKKVYLHEDGSHIGAARASTNEFHRGGSSIRSASLQTTISEQTPKSAERN